MLACGGFEWNREMVNAFIGYDVKPLSPPNNVGDGLVMAMEAGAQIANMNSYWGQPAMFDPGVTRNGELVPQFEWARGEPGSLIVNRHGVRFANESLPYNDFPKTFGRYDPTNVEFPNEAPAWMIFDHRTKRVGAHHVDDARRSCARLDSARGYACANWPPRSASIADTLEATVARFDEHAAKRRRPRLLAHRVKG